MTTVFYGYKHWTLEGVPRCFYVGRGRKGRADSHKSRNHKWHAIVKRYGLRVDVCVECQTRTAANEWETSSILNEGTFSTNHSHDDPLDIGCNFTKGGEGTEGVVWSDETRQKISRSLTGRKLSAKVRQHMREANHPARWQPGNAGFKGRKHSTKARALISENNVGKHNVSELTRERLRQSHMGKTQDNSTKQKRSKSLALYHHAPLWWFDVETDEQ